MQHHIHPMVKNLIESITGSLINQDSALQEIKHTAERQETLKVTEERGKRRKLGTVSFKSTQI